MSLTDSVPLDRWTLERFGLTPAKLGRRVADKRAPRVFCVSIPKAGTHLLERALCLHPRLYRKLLPTVSGENIRRWGDFEKLLRKVRAGQIVTSHLRFSPRFPEILAGSGVAGVFLIRDPHDIVVSQVHYVAKREDHRMHQAFSEREDASAKLRLAITGDRELGAPSIAERLDYFAGWLDSGCLVIRFEDLVGPAGGGDAIRQRDAVASLFRHVGLPADAPTVASISDRLFSSDSPTFRKGSIGGWRSSFDPELEALFDEVVGDRAVPYGYQPAGGAPSS
ncbi:MAG: sulfotransferase domain-containing protein [Actinomycetota bacterium]|nr:sulfotransferase domain-containing protein [Actinomycetota bacterium]